MNYKLPDEVLKIMDKFQNKGYQIFIVGGAVRDLLMGKEVKDWDFTTDAKPEEILKIFPKGFYNNKFGTVGIRSDDSIFEITTMRKEGRYEDFRHPTKISWTNKIEEDLKRRDFTINAIALRLPSPFDVTQGDPEHQSNGSVAQGNNPSMDQGRLSYELVDPFHGQKDIKNKLIRAVGDPNTRFQEDALRLIRAIRIATELEFDIDEKTFESIKNNAHLLKEIANERIRDELFKILESMNPRLPKDAIPGGQAYIGIVKLREAGILQIILPELEKCFGIVQKGPKHARVYDIGEHSLLSLKHTPSADPLVRLAALLHDIGKTDTVKVTPDGNVTFYHHDVVGGQIVLKIAKRFNLSKKQTDKLFKLVRFHMFTVAEDQTDSAIRRFIKNVGLENIEDMLALRVGDRLGGGTGKETSWRMEEFKKRIKQVLKKPFSLTDLKVDGNDVMEVLQIKPGPKVGEILQKLFEEVLEDSSKNNKDYLLKRIKELG